MSAQNSNAEAGTEKSPRRPVAPSPRLPLSVIIIGGGMGGLSAAIHLRLAGYEVTVYEANERVGGRANLI